jgi:hypothetical protein
MRRAVRLLALSGSGWDHDQKGLGVAFFVWGDRFGHLHMVVGDVDPYWDTDISTRYPPDAGAFSHCPAVFGIVGGHLNAFGACPRSVL